MTHERNGCMPALLAHYVFAQRVMQQMEHAGIPVHNKNAALIGAQGPDVLFFHRVLPWQSGTSYAKLGSCMHHISPVRLFDELQRTIAADSRDREFMLGYMLGFICHYALDRTTHPYVYWAQDALEHDDPGYGKGRTRKHQYHFRIESALDTIILRRETGQHVTNFDLSTAAPELSERELNAFARLYAPTLRRLFGVDAAHANLIHAPSDMRRIFRLINDKSLNRRRLLTLIERAARQGPFATSLLRPADISDWDYANTDHKQWHNPADPPRTYTSGFFELYDDATVEAFDMVTRFMSELPNGCMMSLTGNRNFHTGINT